MSRDAQLILHTAALQHNFSIARSHAPHAEVYAMVKANGYGHGMGWAANALASQVDGFGVAHVDEARQLRQIGIQTPLLLLEGVFDQAELLLAADLQCALVIHSLWQLELIEQLVQRELQSSRPLKVWLKLETGMHRLGLPASQWQPALNGIRQCQQLELAGLMTHFACADQQDDSITVEQLQRVTTLADSEQQPFSTANSAALLRYPQSHGAMVRPGIMLYGSSPLEGKKACDLGLQPTQTLSARLIAINEIQAGETVGYGATWKADKDGRIGVLAIGYGDGYPRHAPSGTPVYINGQYTGTCGRVSMDMTMIDLTDVTGVEPGDSVELWGRNVDVDEVANLCGTISYELFCQVTDRVSRVIE